MVPELRHPGAAIIVPVYDTTGAMFAEHARSAEMAGADVVEWRLDYLVGSHASRSLADAVEAIPEVLATTRLPLMLTLRTAGQGGEADISPGHYGVMLAELLDMLVHAKVEPTRVMLDVEFSNPSATSLARRAQELGFMVVLSQAELAGTPDCDMLEMELEELLEVPGVIAHLAVTARGDEDVQHLLEATRAVRGRYDRPIIAVAMGPEGLRSKREGYRYGSAAAWASIDWGQGLLPGQISVEELLRAFAECAE
ncbi:type I 3-dehydroquinate dehydratase [Actinobaculum sp. 352]|uniref:type I 3-dehydroquinate dehydratase n=1 Tax=Actinobaculum sp. 352 TaxID=2490946 RepID=UPI001F49851B|nr:type I 3-dehydroquinate dehydratase [Actinobaculum sp. 352]